MQCAIFPDFALFDVTEPLLIYVEFALRINGQIHVPAKGDRDACACRTHLLHIQRWTKRWGQVGPRLREISALPFLAVA